MLRNPLYEIAFEAGDEQAMQREFEVAEKGYTQAWGSRYTIARFEAGDAQWETTRVRIDTEEIQARQQRGHAHRDRLREVGVRNAAALDKEWNMAREIPDYEFNPRHEVEFLFGTPAVHPQKNKLLLRMLMREFDLHEESRWMRYRCDIYLENRAVTPGRSVHLGYVGVRYNTELMTLEGDGFYNYTSMTTQHIAFAAAMQSEYGVSFRHILPLALGCLLRDVILKRDICDSNDRMTIYASGLVQEGRDFFGTQFDLVRYYKSIGFETVEATPITSRYPLRNQTEHITATTDQGVGVKLVATNLGTLMKNQFRLCAPLWTVSDIFPIAGAQKDSHTHGWQFHVANSEFPDIKRSCRTHEVVQAAEGLEPRVIRLRTENEIATDFLSSATIARIRGVAAMAGDIKRESVRQDLMTLVRELDDEEDKAKKKRKTLGEQMRLLRIG